MIEITVSNTNHSDVIQAEIQRINEIMVFLARWLFPVITFFALINNTLNIYVFTRPCLRRHPCCMYFLSSSTAALVFTLINFPLRTLQYGYNIDPTSSSISICKMKFYFTYTMRAIISWYLVLACVDRFLHSSSISKIRRLSSFRMASRAIPIIFFLVSIGYSHVLIFYKINSNQSCTSNSVLYGKLLGIWHLVFYGLGPPLLMLHFSILTIRHVRNRHKIPAITTANQIKISNRDNHLLRMALVQCLFVGLTTLIYAGFQLYSSLSINQRKDRLQMKKDSLFTLIFGTTSAIGHTATFFVFTLTSKMFRKQISCLC
ncbi:hypothetical protein I4U23_021895 [Adineta vaga]|nr:hypothetical protein I4U23_021895 [Adineta vaga]